MKNSRVEAMRKRSEHRSRYAQPLDHITDLVSETGWPTRGTKSFILLERAACSMAQVCRRFGVREIRVATTVGRFDVSITVAHAPNARDQVKAESA